MEKRRTRSRTRRTQEEKLLDDVPSELLHHIQLLLSEKEAARTCLLSKSWHHAWSTFPNLSFPKHYNISETKNNELIYKTIQRYNDNHLPIQSLDFTLHLRHLDYTTAEFWFRHVLLSSQTRNYLTELSLEICGRLRDARLFTFSDDQLFSGDKLQTIKLKATGTVYRANLGVNPVIKCSSLRVLELGRVNISEEVFHNLFSTCSLLEKVVLFFCKGFKTIKIKNLACLGQLEIISPEKDFILEIDNVPSLGFFCYKMCGAGKNPLPFKSKGKTATSLGRNVTQLHLDGLINARVFNMIKSKFPFLESLKLEIKRWSRERLVITSLSLKRLTLHLVRGLKLINLQVNAQKLLSFDYQGKVLPTLLFTIAPREIKLALNLIKNPFDTSFFLKLREVLVLNLSSKFVDIYIQLPPRRKSPYHSILKAEVVDDLRKRALFPVTNVQQLSLDFIALNDRFREHTRVSDAFFSICHPIHVKLLNHNKGFSKSKL